MAREAEAPRGGNKRIKLDIALGEAYEVKASFELALAWGHIDDSAPTTRSAHDALARAVLGTGTPAPASA